MSKHQHQPARQTRLNTLARLVERLSRLNQQQLRDVERLVQQMTSNQPTAATVDDFAETSAGTKDWPHAPLHRLSERGTFIVTAGTLGKEHFFRDAGRLDYLEAELLAKAKQYNWQLEAWAVFSNHYHFVGHAVESAESLRPFLAHLHSDTAREVNRRDNVRQRQVWFNFWETQITFEKSYLARLNYVHQNAVRHQLVAAAALYRWCSAAWFERTATPAQVKTIYSFRTDRLKVIDDFDVLGVD